MKEKQIEQKLVKAIKAHGGLALKFVSPGNDGVPDRLVLMPHGTAFFVELKAPGKKPRPLQVIRMKQLEALGFDCFVLDNDSKIDEVIRRGIHSA